MTATARYKNAYYDYMEKTAPGFFEASGGRNMLVTMPKIKTANGLTNFIVKYLTWKGWRATRVNTTGRLVDKQEKQPSGISLMTKKWIHGTTRKGTADVSSTINGRSVMWEVKIGRDKPSEYQLREQQLERSAGGEYFFVHTPEEFFELYDAICYG